jgi:hypothetical protein
MEPDDLDERVHRFALGCPDSCDACSCCRHESVGVCEAQCKGYATEAKSLIVNGNVFERRRVSSAPSTCISSRFPSARGGRREAAGTLPERL